MNLSELIEEFRDIEVCDIESQDWMNYLERDTDYVPDHELVY